VENGKKPAKMTAHCRSTATLVAHYTTIAIKIAYKFVWRAESHHSLNDQPTQIVPLIYGECTLNFVAGEKRNAKCEFVLRG
jgi:hypothetical protein